MGDVNPQESERTPLKPREIAYAITRGNSCVYDSGMSGNHTLSKNISLRIQAAISSIHTDVCFGSHDTDCGQCRSRGAGYLRYHQQPPDVVSVCRPAALRSRSCRVCILQQVQDRKKPDHRTKGSGLISNMIRIIQSLTDHA